MILTIKRYVVYRYPVSVITDRQFYPDSNILHIPTLVTTKSSNPKAYITIAIQTRGTGDRFGRPAQSIIRYRMLVF